MVFVLRDGETLHGVIEWYDKCCLKVNRTEGPEHPAVQTRIKYMYKEGVERSRPVQALQPVRACARRYSRRSPACS